jgi:hypothetical protein
MIIGPLTNKKNGYQKYIDFPMKERKKRKKKNKNDSAVNLDFGANLFVNDPIFFLTAGITVVK